MLKFMLCLLLPALGGCQVQLPLEVPANKQALLEDYQRVCTQVEGMCEWPVDLTRDRGLASIYLDESMDQPLIFGNPTRLLALRARFGPWAVAWVFAHEAGHYLDYKRGMFDPFLMDSPATEESADEWGGCILRMAGASEDDLKQAINMALIVLRDGGDTHPPGSVRAAAALRGYEKCGS